ncbi:hypothetical protein [Pseudolactococcus insecticola]|uniref:Uncharacterized protein n=1 Tax=Pseudolactococcus insecticola TaxID=2709158 RepID=A0A6A0B7N5_9LACT|nr:hypothetical protein [Lactococcus insecticola]GFH41302.1 hypothetical protein Hs20B_17000 [Lactococcus insecticola]
MSKSNKSKMLNTEGKLRLLSGTLAILLTGSFAIIAVQATNNHVAKSNYDNAIQKQEIVYKAKVDTLKSQVDSLSFSVKQKDELLTMAKNGTYVSWLKSAPEMGTGNAN